MRHKIISLFAATAILCSLCNFTTVSAYYTSSASSRVIYKNDFSTGYQFSGNNDGQLGTIGGWDKSGKGAFQKWPLNDNASDLGFVPGSAPGVADIAANAGNGSSEWYIPGWARYSTGTYTFKFNYYRGTKSYKNYFGFNDAIKWDTATTENLFELDTVDSTAASELNGDYGCKRYLIITFDMDSDEVTCEVYNTKGGTLKGSANATWSRTNLTYISFRFQGNANIAAANNLEGYVSMVDDFEVSYAPSSGTLDRGYPMGNIYAQEFEFDQEEFITEGDWRNGNGGWAFNIAGPDGEHANYTYTYDSTDSYGNWKNTYAGPTVGKGDCSMGFCPAWAPGSKMLKYYYTGSAYIIPNSKRVRSGVYKIRFDFKLGSKCWNQRIYIGAGDLDSSNYVMKDLRYTSGVNFTDTTSWHLCEIVVDVDNHTFQITTYNADGSVRGTQSEDWNYDHVGYVEFYSRFTTDLSKASDNNDVNYSFCIDNLEIDRTEQNLVYSQNFESGSLGTTFGARALVTSGEGLPAGGGWDNADSSAFKSGSGINQSKGWRVGQNSNRTGSYSSEYFLPVADVHDYGQYRISYWMKKGSNLNSTFLMVGDGDTYEYNDGECKINSFTDLPEDWVYVDIVLDFDMNRYCVQAWTNWGSLKKYANGKLNSNDSTRRITRLRHLCFWENPKSSNARGSIIDNLTIKYYDNHCVTSGTIDDTTYGITFGSTAATFNEITNNYSWMNYKNVVLYIAAYDASGKLIGFNSQEKTAAVQNSTGAYVSIPLAPIGSTYKAFVWMNRNSSEGPNKAIAEVVSATR